MRNRILNGILEDFKSDFLIRDKSEQKIFEQLVSYVVCSKIHPEAFNDLSIFEKLDVDKKSTFGLDTFALIINNSIITEVEQIDEQRKCNFLNVKFIFIQSKTSENLDSGEILKFTTSVKNILADDQSIQLSDELLTVKELINKVYERENARLFTSKPVCELYYATAGTTNPDNHIDGVAKGACVELERLNSDIKSASIRFINSNYIIESHKELQNNDNVAIKFKNSISCGNMVGVEQAYIGYLPASEFLKLITGFDGNLRQNLFYENVRDFQGLANSVNEEISKTLNNENYLDKFILLNNGVTIVAKSFKNIRSDEFEISDFYIVNGCQTSNMIFANKSRIGSNDSVNIPLKIIHTHDNDIIARIIRSTNRQTPVPDEAFVALEKFHKTLQDFYKYYSAQAPEKLYYERRSKEFSGAREYIPKSRIINLHSQIKSYAAVILGYPHLPMTRNPSAILSTHKSEMFIEGNICTPYYLSSLLLFKFYEALDKGEVDRKYEISRYFICWISRIIATKKISATSNDTKSNEEMYEAIVLNIATDGFILGIFQTACIAFDTIKENYCQEFGHKKNGEIVKLKDFRDKVKEFMAQQRFLNG